MPSFLSQYGVALLDIQDKIRRNIRDEAGDSFAPNLITLWLDTSNVPHDVIEDHSIGNAQHIEEMRSSLLTEIQEFVEASGWSFSGPLCLNILFEDSREDPTARVDHRDHFFNLILRDDSGTRKVSAERPSIVVGRQHSPAPRGLIGLQDSSKALSREHILLTMKDARLEGKLLGMNETFVNGDPWEKGTTRHLYTGDVVECGPHSIEVERLLV